MKNLKRIRLLNEYTQLKVQMETGISQSTLSKYETGEAVPTVENLLLLARLYHTSLDYLMDLTEQTAPYPAKK
ncbi:MAG: helix-turn-helix transcriptional regulator [Clostridia bacterium]|nr:helix-turn-helix transcriptional regulator [Clostridia bacterium]